MADELQLIGADDYLARVAARLGLPEPYASEVREELAAHLTDATYALIAEGLTPEQAEREAIARLGSPDALADELRHAHQTRRRLLAGAAGGVWAAAGHGIGGTLLGIGLLFVIFVPLTFTEFALRRLAGMEWRDLGGQEWNAVFYPLAMCVGAFLAGRRAVQAMAAKSLRRRHQVAGWWAVSGFAILALWVLFVLRMPLSWPAVAAELLIPLSFAVGAVVMIDRQGPRIRNRHILLAALLAIVLPTLLAIGLGPASMGGGGVQLGPTFSSTEEYWQANRFDLVGRLPPQDMEMWPFIGGWSTRPDGSVTFTAEIVPGGDRGTWHDLRYEAWRALPGFTTIDPSFRAPFAAAPAELQGDRLKATFRVDRTPGVTFYAIFLTGVGPDGQRYLLTGPDFGATTFVGTIWEWLTAQ